MGYIYTVILKEVSKLCKHILSSAYSINFSATKSTANVVFLYETLPFKIKYFHNDKLRMEISREFLTQSAEFFVCRLPLGISGISFGKQFGCELDKHIGNLGFLENCSEISRELCRRASPSSKCQCIDISRVPPFSFSLDGFGGPRGWK
ncbi:hypothetical protein PUN28_012534 [Cardiocondyla obscurior]|uniref:Uncharacterized protein n=1 Tax=Cardiocondyla obscurior TaxID=286306 RepID=A0AAW2FC46_9HYME